MIEAGLRGFIDRLEAEHPEQIVHVGEPVDPAHFDVTAVLKHLELRRKFPLVVFDRPLGRPLDGSPEVTKRVPFPRAGSAGIAARAEGRGVGRPFPRPPPHVALRIDHARVVTDERCGDRQRDEEDHGHGEHPR